MSLDIEKRQSIALLRACISFLGEKDQCNWWPSSFLSKSGEIFLTPVFPKTNVMARITGASIAAQVVHDEHIGIGDVFHLFRLPENIEHDISQALAIESSILDNISSKDTAHTTLQMLTNGDTTQGIGPLLLNQNKINETVINQMASAYLAGFNNNQTVYPYYKGN